MKKLKEIFMRSSIAPIIIGAQLAIPFAILASSIFLGEKVNIKQWSLILISFLNTKNHNICILVKAWVLPASLKGNVYKVMVN